ncbi:MAG: Rdx family protein [Anaerolineales bacterium]|nr:Rdx family protein [Anaerolineales bacterium]
MTEILSDENLERQIEAFSLVPSDGGKFEFSANGELLYSKLRTGRHVEPGELRKILTHHLK